jgi:tetratricopeptide (TPR) repeat protein
VIREEGDLKARAELYRGNRMIWQDPVPAGGPSQMRGSDGRVVVDPDYGFRRISVTLGGQMAPGDSARSLARTWAELMNVDPFKSLLPRPKVGTPDPDPGQMGLGPTGGFQAAPADDDELMQAHRALWEGGKRAQALNLLRDGVDLKPFDLGRREALVEALLLMHRPELAAGEARRAAMLLPQSVQMRLTGARAWLLARRPEEARLDLNEVLARDPRNEEGRLLLAECALWMGDAAAALESLEGLDSDQARFFRAASHALVGDLEEAEAALPSELGPASMARHALVFALSEKLASLSGAEMRSLTQQAVIRKDDPEVARAIHDRILRFRGTTWLLRATAPPEAHKNSHERLVLAFNLLNQSTTDLQAYLQDRSEDVLTEARINLGEALMQLAAARDAYAAETARSDGDDEHDGIRPSDTGSFSRFARGRLVRDSSLFSQESRSAAARG